MSATANEEGKQKPGPAPSEIKLDQVETLASIGCTLEEIGAVVGLSKRTLIRREKDDELFLEAIERGRAKGRASLRRVQWNAAHSGNITAQIWLGKQLLGQRSFEREEKKDNAAATAPPLIIQTYPNDPTDQTAEPGVPEPGALPPAGGGT